MSEFDANIENLSKRLEQLIAEQKGFISEIKALKSELEQLKAVGQARGYADDKRVAPKTQDQEQIDLAKTLATPKKAEPIPSEKVFLDESGNKIPVQPSTKHIEITDSQAQKSEPKAKSILNSEKFIGENLISKIGILITILGVGIGVKYAIENELISPLTRIMFGYILGGALLFVAIKLKQKYTSYSAVLLSGAMAIMYLVTFAAYNFYGLFSQIVAFVMMFFFTVFTVKAALNYNKQVIALIGLVGAYAVPILLSDGSGRVVILFSYMAIINIGILVIAFQKMWKILYYSAFAITWLIFISWYVSFNNSDTNYAITATFLPIFFITFYIIYLAYKVLKIEKLDAIDVGMLLLNSFIFYGIGYNLLVLTSNDSYLGLFALLNALIHFGFSFMIYKKQLANSNIFYLLISLVIVFVTIAFPVQLDGFWVTMFWVAEAVLLFWLGRSKKISTFEIISYVLMVLSLGSLLQDWNVLRIEQLYSNFYRTTLFNIYFLNAILFLFGYALIFYFSQKIQSSLENKTSFLHLFKFCLVGIFIAVLYYTFFIEIDLYWQKALIASSVEVPYVGADDEFAYTETQKNFSLLYFKNIWIANYTLLFTSVLAFLNVYKFRSPIFGKINLGLMLLSLLYFLTAGLMALSNLRYKFLIKDSDHFFEPTTYFIFIRYISFAFLALLLFAFYKYYKASFMQIKNRMPFDLLFYSVILWVASSELINLMDLANSTQTYKLGLSILWGVYALVLISIGIIKKLKYLRIWAISLFGFTLVKLFFYDLAYLSTISKIIVLISLGILLLIISFLYNKYKNIINDES